MRLDESGPADALYRTGTFQIRGAESESDIFDSADRSHNVLSQVGVEVPDYEFNHVTSIFIEEFDQDVNLEALTTAFGMENTEYEPE